MVINPRKEGVDIKNELIVKMLMTEYITVNKANGDTEKMMKLMFMDETGLIMTIPISEHRLDVAWRSLDLSFKGFETWVNTGKLPKFKNDDNSKEKTYHHSADISIQ